MFKQLFGNATILAAIIGVLGTIVATLLSGNLFRSNKEIVIITQPDNAKIEIFNATNERFKYTQGMKVKSGNYRIVVSANNHTSKEQWIGVEDKDRVIGPIVLVPKPSVERSSVVPQPSIEQQPSVEPQPSVELEPIFNIDISATDAKRIGEIILKNEMNGNKSDLIYWHKKENFISLGIGHFIWYPKGQEQIFIEDFPLFIELLKEKRYPLPNWLSSESYCPWNSRDEFLREKQSSKMITLSKILYDTVQLQVEFITRRFKKSIPVLFQAISSHKESTKIIAQFNRLVKTPSGLYILADYINFKGEGTELKERYRGQGWGLLQVLEKMTYQSENAIFDFINAAELVLTQRVKNAPKDESHFLSGWLNRINNYAKLIDKSS